MKKLCLLLIVLCHAVHGHWFSYDTAVAQAQKGNWHGSKETLTQLVVDKTTQADVLYDTGVASFKTQEYDKALAYFTQAAATADNTHLQERAYFNQGNTYVQLKELQKALDSYDKVLSLNPDNEKAAHNKEVVKKLMQQQKQQQEKKNQQDKKEQEKDTQEKKQQDADRSQQCNEKKDEQENEQQQSGDTQQHNQDKSHDEQNRDDRSDDQSGNQDEQKNTDAHQQDHGTQADQQQQQKDGTEKKDAGSVSNSAPQRSSEKKETGDEKVSPLLARFLKEQEKKDAQMNKQMIKAMVGNAGASDGFNNW